MHVRGDYAYIAYYTDGLRIVDVEDAPNPAGAGIYDPVSGGWASVEDSWGVYPFSPSGIIVFTDMDDGIYTCRFPAGEEVGSALTTSTPVVARGGSVELDASVSNLRCEMHRMASWPTLLGVLLIAGSAQAVSDTRCRIRATRARLNRVVIGDVIRTVGGMPAEPVDSACWSSEGSVPLERARILIDVDPIRNIGSIHASWIDENGVWTFDNLGSGKKQTCQIAPRFGSDSADPTECNRRRSRSLRRGLHD